MKVEKLSLSDLGIWSQEKSLGIREVAACGRLFGPHSATARIRSSSDTLSRMLFRRTASWSRRARSSGPWIELNARRDRASTSLRDHWVKSRPENGAVATARYPASDTIMSG